MNGKTNTEKTHVVSKETFDKEVKCVIWDLDNTIWDGILAESDPIELRPGIVKVIQELDSRGILQSIASKNNYKDAMDKLVEFGIDRYFIYPEIHWSPKSGSIENIRNNLNIGMDSILFIDDQEFERDEVFFYHPEVETVDSINYMELLKKRRLHPKFITEDSKRRRLMYQEDIKRNEDEEKYKGSKTEFLASLGMRFIISKATESDLKRAEELTIRTNQLNSTGRTYDYDELNELMNSVDHKLLVCELSDKYGSYGKIGLALIELDDVSWTIKLLLMSCRVMSRSVGSVLLTYIMQQAKKNNMKLLADFKTTDRNSKMYSAYRILNFNEKTNDGSGNILLENDLTFIPALPHYLQMDCVAL